MSAMHAVVVHDAVQAALATALAADILPADGRLALLSGPSAALYLSPRLFLAMTGPATPRVLPVLDCSQAPGHALAALRAGCPALVLPATCPAFPALAAAAAADECGALLLPEAPAALDLATLRLGTPHDDSRLRAWLARPLPAGAAR